MNDSTGGSVIDGNKFIWNGATIEDSSNCYFQVRSRDHAGQFSVKDTSDAPSVLRAAREASNGWRKVEPSVRIAALQNLSTLTSSHGAELSKAIMWDTDRCAKMALAELETAMTVLNRTIEEYARWITEEQGGEAASTLRAVGSVVCFGPEMSSTFGDILRIAVPALLVGCTVLVKVPCSHGLVHIIASQFFSDALPPGVIQFLLGPAEELLATIARDPRVNMVAVTGERSVADRLIHAHPKPHRLKLFLDLAGDILAVINPDAPSLNAACREIAESVLTERGRSHLKLVFVHGSIAQEVLPRLTGILKEWKSRSDVLLAPSCDGSPVERAQQLVIDALRKGAMVVNVEDGGGRLVTLLHGRTMQPTLLYPVNDTMRVWREDLRGTGIIAVAPFEQVSEIAEYARGVAGKLQVSLFDRSGLEGDLGRALKEDIDGCHHGSRLVLNSIHESPSNEARRLFRAFTTDEPLEQCSEAEEELVPPVAESTEETGGVRGSLTAQNPPSCLSSDAPGNGEPTAGNSVVGERGGGGDAEGITEGTIEVKRSDEAAVGVFGSPVSVAAMDRRSSAKQEK